MEPIILGAVQILRKSFGENEVEILDTDLQYKYISSIGKSYYGVDILVKSFHQTYKAFLTFQMAEDIVSFPPVGEQYIYDIIKDEFKKLKLQFERNEKLQKISELGEFNNKTN
jgi:hypothetical protein